MEEILSSIKRIIADEGESLGKSVSRAAVRAKAGKKAAEQDLSAADESQDVETGEGILELTEAVAPEFDEEARQFAPPPQPEGGEMTDKTILSNETAAASRSSLAALSALLIRPDDAPPNTLEGLVREMLKPMLREWLDANLPDLVEKMVAKEIARLTAGQL
ncbi:MAG TPA: DUF2497 domain-containing protein [Rhizorhapis sp.]|nr:DUF2497 domain-containing protein [Rhizorhapis sp.]